MEDGDAPMFRVTAEDAPEQPMVGVSPSGAWKAVMEATSTSSSHVSGTDFFGLTSPAVTKCILVDDYMMMVMRLLLLFVGIARCRSMRQVQGKTTKDDDP